MEERREGQEVDEGGRGRERDRKIRYGKKRGR